MPYPAFLVDLARKVRTALDPALATGLEPFEHNDGTVVVNGLVLPRQRCYPLRTLGDGRKPTVTSRHAIHNPSRPTHRGVDFFYAYKPGDPPMKIADGGRTAKWWIPDNTWSVAAADGLVEVAGNSKTGYRVWVAHAGGLRTGGFHHTMLKVRPGDAVRMGEPLGLVGDNPADNDARHLHWEVYKGPVRAYPQGTIDPERWLAGATILSAR